MGNPKNMIQIDEGGSSYSQPVIEDLDREKIEIHGTRGHPALLYFYHCYSFLLLFLVPSTTTPPPAPACELLLSRQLVWVQLSPRIGVYRSFQSPRATDFNVPAAGTLRPPKLPAIRELKVEELRSIQVRAAQVSCRRLTRALPRLHQGSLKGRSLPYTPKTLNPKS